VKKLLFIVLAWLTAIGIAFAAVDINTASEAELDKLPGIGPVKAKAIVAERQKNGPFKSVDDLKRVKGIGDKVFDKLKTEITVSGGGAKPAAAKPAAAAAPAAAPATTPAAAPAKPEAKAAALPPAKPAEAKKEDKAAKPAEAKKDEQPAKAAAGKEAKDGKGKTAKDKAAKDKDAAAKDDKKKSGKHLKDAKADDSGKK
jgi:competence protein ComEA